MRPRIERKSFSLFLLTHKDGLNGLFYDAKSGEIWNGEKNEPIVALPKKQAATFGLLVSHPNEIQSTQNIAEAVYGDRCLYPLYDVGIKTNIGRIRRALEEIDPSLKERLVNVRGFGYRWDDFTLPRIEI